MKQLVEHLREKSAPKKVRRWLFNRREPEPEYLFPIRPGATQPLLDETAARLGLAIPDDVRLAYSLMDGMEDYTGTDAGFMRLLPLADWILLSEEQASAAPSRFSRNVIISDYSIWAWWYAIELENPDEIGWIRCFGGGDSWLVSRSFDEYLDLTLSDDAVLYGPRDDGAAV